MIVLEKKEKLKHMNSEQIKEAQINYYVERELENEEVVTEMMLQKTKSKQMKRQETQGIGISDSEDDVSEQDPLDEA